MARPKKVKVRKYTRRTTRGRKAKVKSYERKAPPTGVKSRYSVIYARAIARAINNTKHNVTTAEVAKHFGMHSRTAERYLNFLAKNHKIKKIIINGRIRWRS